MWQPIKVTDTFTCIFVCQKLFNILHKHESSGTGIYRGQVANNLLHKCKFPSKLKFFSDFKSEY